VIFSILHEHCRVKNLRGRRSVGWHLKYPAHFPGTLASLIRHPYKSWCRDLASGCPRLKSGCRPRAWVSAEDAWARESEKDDYLFRCTRCPRADACDSGPACPPFPANYSRRQIRLQLPWDSIVIHVRMLARVVRRSVRLDLTALSDSDYPTHPPASPSSQQSSCSVTTVLTRVVGFGLAPCAYHYQR
jgi:hypothetical protein